LERVADIFERDRFDIMALQVLEVGKNWGDADGDVTEAIDFCRYYAREICRLDKPEQVSHVLGESGLYYYKPRGVSLVIAPWNFPLAILTGQVVASIVTGNTCIMKPAEQSSATAKVLIDALMEAKCPKNVVQFLPGLGEVVGRHLVNH